MRAQKIAKLKNKEYRDAFVGSQISIGIPFQIRALREQREWKQSQLAQETGMLQPRISAMESPGGAKFTIETLRRLASAFDVALMVKFVPFSDLLRWSEDFNPDSFLIPSFENDSGLIERREQEIPLSPKADINSPRLAGGCRVPDWARRLDYAIEMTEWGKQFTWPHDSSGKSAPPNESLPTSAEEMKGPKFPDVPTGASPTPKPIERIDSWNNGSEMKNNLPLRKAS